MQQLRVAIALLQFWVVALGLPVAATVFAVRTAADPRGRWPELVIAVMLAVMTGVLYHILWRYGAHPRPGGLRLNESDAPAMFAMLREIAGQAGISADIPVYVDLGAEMKMAPCGSGLRAGRALVVGMPSLLVLRVEELRTALLFLCALVRSHGVLRRWLDQTQAIVSRYMGDPDSAAPAHPVWTRIARELFRPYLKRTAALLERDEAEARETVLRALGPDALDHVNQLFTDAATLFSEFGVSDLGPVLAADRVPPVLEGFSDFLEARGRRPDEPALTILRAPWVIEHRIAADFLGEHPKFSRIQWGEVAEDALLPRWEKELESNAPALDGWTVGELPVRLRSESAEHAARRLPEGWRAEALPSFVGRALGVVLWKFGWRCTYRRAGCPLHFESRGRVVDPFDTVRRIASGELTPAEWHTFCAETGLAGVFLGPS